MKTLEKYGIENDSHGDQLWSMLNGRTPAVVLTGFGASEIVPIRKDDGYQKFMVKMDGWWNYAHTDGTSVYVSLRRKYYARTAVTAFAMLEHDQRVDSLVHRMEDVRVLTDAIATIRENIRAEESSK